MFDEFPYTDLHNLNLDWFLEQFKHVIAEFKKVVAEFKKLEAEINDISSSTGLSAAQKSTLISVIDAIGVFNVTNGRELINAFDNAWNINVTSISVNPTTLTFNESGSQTIIATTIPSGVSVVWTSSNPSVATVNNGVVTSIGNGTCTITASSGDKSATCEVSVSGFATLVSISAVYTQSSTIYESDTLESLRSDLVVTAIYDNSTTQTVTDYTLSGTLTYGTSTITVSYGGKTTTFNVIVSQTISPIYDWDFTQSLIDSVNGVSATLTGATRDSNGILFSAQKQEVRFGDDNLNPMATNRTLEIDVASFVFGGSTDYNIRFIMFDTSNGPLIWNHNSIGWSMYSGSWGNIYTGLSGSTTEIMNYFNGKTIKIYIDNNGYSHLYVDGESKGVSTVAFGTISSLRIGSQGAVSVGGQLYAVLITGVRIYEGEV